MRIAHQVCALPLVALLLSSAPAYAQTGTLDQDNTANNNVGWNMTYNLDLQQDVYVGVAGQLEGVMIRMWAQTVGMTLPVLIYNGAGPHLPSEAPAYATSAVATTSGSQQVFVDVTTAALTYAVGDFFTLRVGDGVTVPTGIDLTGNSGWPGAYYPHAQYTDLQYSLVDRIYFRSYMIPCPSPAGVYGQGCPGSFGKTPKLALQGCPSAGSQITLGITDGLASSTAILVIGLGPISVPVGSGCSLLAGPLLGAPIAGLPLSGVGALSIPAIIPAAVTGVSLTLQAFVVDSANTIGVSATNGLSLTIP